MRKPVAAEPLLRQYEVDKEPGATESGDSPDGKANGHHGRLNGADGSGLGEGEEELPLSFLMR